MRSKSRPGREPLPPFGALPIGTPAREQPAKRDRRLLIALWVSLPVIVLALVMGLALVSLQLWSWSAARSAGAGDGEAAAASYQRQATLTQRWPTPWVAEYNLGTMQLRTDRVDAGIEHLKRAYETVPKAIPAEDGTIQTFTYECQVRINLATGLERVADGQRSAGQLQAALDTYDGALGWSKPCQGAADASQAEQQGQGGSDGSGGQSSPDQQNQGGRNGQDQSDAGSSTSDRIEQKRQQTERELGGQSDGTGSAGGQEQQDQEQQNSNEGGSGQDQQGQASDPYAGETEQERAQRESLQQKNQQQQESQREWEESAHRNPGANGW